MQRKPKSEMGKLIKLQGGGSSYGKAIGDEAGAKGEWTDRYEFPAQESF